MIKLCLLIPTLDRSGAEKQFTLLATGLPRNEFDVRVIALTRGGPYEQPLREAGLPVTILHKRWKFDPIALKKLRRFIAEFDPDVLHSFLFAGNAYARLVAGRLPRPKVIVSERCVDIWKHGWQKWLDKRQFKRTHRLIANSQSVAEFYRELGCPDEKLVVIPNAVEIDERPPSHAERDAALAQLDIPAGAKVVGYVGRLAPQKRIRDLVWAFQLLRQVTENVYFLVVGDGPERTEAERMAAHFGCDALVRFTGHREDARKLIRLLNVFWLGSDFEGMSNSLMEAMAAGVPAVVSDIPPNRELTVDGETGFVVKAGDSVGLSQFADRIMADPALAARLGEAARERMRAGFTVEQMIASHAALYRDALS